MFFASSGFSSLMATHPPLEKRILAIDPQWKGEMLKGAADEAEAGEFGGASGFSGATGPAVTGLDSLGDSARLDSHVGALIRQELLSGNVTSFSKREAKTLLLGLLVAADEDARKKAEAIMAAHGTGAEDILSVIGWSGEIAGYPSSRKLALVDLSLSWLRKMSRGEAEDFVKASRALIEADGEVNLFEFMLQKVIERHVCIGLGLKPVPPIRYRSIVDLEREIALVLGAFFTLAGGGTAMDTAAAEYHEHTGRVLPRIGGGLQEVADALVEMDGSTPLVKQQILRMCGLVVTDDGTVQDQEMELLRATAEAIGAPVPPLVRKLT